MLGGLTGILMLVVITTCMKKSQSKWQRTQEDHRPPPPAPTYEDIEISPHAGGTSVENQLELKDNIAYGQVR